MTQKQGTTRHVPISSTLKSILTHKDVLTFSDMFSNKMLLLILISKHLKMAEVIELIHFWIQIPIYLTFVCTMIVMVLLIHLVIRSINIQLLHSVLCWEISHLNIDLDWMIYISLFYLQLHMEVNMVMGQ